MNDVVNAMIEGAPSHLDLPWAASLPVWHDAVTVYFIKRTDGSVYATLTNRHLYGDLVLDKLAVHRFSNQWSIQTSPVVDQHLKILQAQVKEKCTSPNNSRRGF